MTYSAAVIADYLLSLTDPDVGDVMTRLYLQKLLYYAQGFHLALYDWPLFPEPPWAATPLHAVIAHTDLRAYFQTLVVSSSEASP